MTDFFQTIAGASPDFTTSILWENDSDRDLIADGDNRTGQLQVMESVSTTLFLEGETADADNHRTLTFGGDGVRYDPDADTGAGRTSTEATAGCIWQKDAQFCEIIGIQIESTVSGAYPLLRSGGTVANAVYDGCTIRNSGGFFCVLQFDEMTFRNCTFIQEASANCISIQNSAITIDNCVVYSSAGSVGVWIRQDDTADTVIRNTISMGWSSTDFLFEGSDTNGTYSNNVSEDTSAPGSDSHASETIGDILTDADNDDFTLVSTGNAVEGGVDLSGTFTTDQRGIIRATPWDMGPIEFTAPGDIAPIVATQNRNRIKAILPM